MTTDNDSFKRLTAFAMIGQQATKIRDEQRQKLEKMMLIMDQTSDDEFEKIKQFAFKIGGQADVDHLVKLREMWKNERKNNQNKSDKPETQSGIKTD